MHVSLHVNSPMGLCSATFPQHQHLSGFYVEVNNLLQISSLWATHTRKHKHNKHTFSNVIGLWDSSDRTPTAEHCPGGWILLFNPAVSREVIWCWPGRLTRRGVEGQITTPDGLSNHIYFIAKGKMRTPTLDCSLIALCTHSLTKQGTETLQIVWVERFIRIVYARKRSKPCNWWKWLKPRQKPELRCDQCQCQQGNPPELQ